MFDWLTKIHIPCKIHYETWIDLSTATLDPFAPNARHKHKNLHLVMEEKKMRTLIFKKDDDTPKRIAPTSIVSIAPLLNSSNSNKERRERRRGGTNSKLHQGVRKRVDGGLR
jgi:hypothetical protein